MKKIEVAAWIAFAGWAAGLWSLQAAPVHPQGAEKGFRAQAREQLDELGRKIDALELKAREQGARSRERLEAQVNRLRAKKSDAEELFNKLQGEAAEAGKDVQARLERALGDLKRGCRKLQKKLEGVRPKSKESHPLRGG